MSDRATDAPHDLSGAKRRIVERLKRADTATAPELAAEFGLTDTAIRQHLEALEAAELVERSSGPSTGRGRPPTHWRLTPGASVLFADRHADLTVELLTSIRTALGEDALDQVVRTRAERQLADLRGGAQVARSTGLALGNNTSSDVSTIGVTVADDDAQSGNNTTTVTVHNVAPTVALNAVSDINENDVATLTGSYTDIGLLDAHTVTVNWADLNNGLASTFAVSAIRNAAGTATLHVGDTFNSSTDSAVLTVTSINAATGQVGFSVQHQYLDDGLALGDELALALVELAGPVVVRPGLGVAAELVERQRTHPFDLVVHQLGNNPLHDFQYPLIEYNWPTDAPGTALSYTSQPFTSDTVVAGTFMAMAAMARCNWPQV